MTAGLKAMAFVLVLAGRFSAKLLYSDWLAENLAAIAVTALGSI